jgi:hypothetical protein
MKNINRKTFPTEKSFENLLTFSLAPSTKFKNGKKMFVVQWKRISRKQSTRWQHLSQCNASAIFSL